jgi:ubiquinone/menaquinone biosynthesis C-methylase UbiE
VCDGQRALDVGCGPGALTAELVSRLGAVAVAAVDPSEPFVAAARERHPGVQVLRASAEHLPFPDRTFDASLAQLVVHFMSDPVAGLAEMARVTRPWYDSPEYVQIRPIRLENAESSMVLVEGLPTSPSQG